MGFVNIELSSIKLKVFSFKIVREFHAGIYSQLCYDQEYILFAEHFPSLSVQIWDTLDPKYILKKQPEVRSSTSSHVYSIPFHFISMKNL
jgi:hypothetical protein